MLILFDNNVPRGLIQALEGHFVTEARERGWATWKNGDLLQAAEQAGFDVLITADRNIRYQQNLAGRNIVIVVLSRQRWELVRHRFAAIASAVNACRPGSYTEVEIPLE